MSGGPQRPERPGQPSRVFWSGTLRRQQTPRQGNKVELLVALSAV